MLLAQSNGQFLPPLAPLALLALLATLTAAGLGLGWLLGAANVVARRWGLWLGGGGVLGCVGIILLNPVRVDELPGPVERPELFYLLDTSSSMQIGSPRSRWDEALARIDEAQRLAESSPVVVKPFRFGQRLAAVEQADLFGLLVDGRNSTRAITPTSAVTRDAAATRPPKSSGLRPTDADTRLFTALRQISSRFGRVPPLGIVVFSDGR